MEELEKEVEELRKENVMGADFLSNWALELFKKYILLQKKVPNLEELKSFALKLIQTRQSMAPVFNKIMYFLHEIAQKMKDHLTFTELLINITLIHKNMKKIEDAGQYRINKFILNKIPDGTVILTHSNSSSVLRALKHVASKKKIKAVVTESRPMNEGRLAAKELIKYMPVTYILDIAAGYWMKHEKVDLLLLGADSVTLNGNLINKIGTYSLALLAKDLDIPFHAICNKWKFDLRELLNQKITIEEKPIKEVWDHAIDNKNLIIKNYYFDITPNYLIKSYITDLGEIKPEKIREEIFASLPVDWIKDNFKF